MRNVHVARGMVRDGRCRKVGATLALTFRRAGVADAEALAHAVIDGFEGYRALRAARTGSRRRWRRRSRCSGPAGRGDDVVPGGRSRGPARRAGHVPAGDASGGAGRRARAGAPAQPVRRPRVLGHRPRRASCTAPLWRRRASAGFARMRLFTPAAHGRARRFYEREGWVQAGEEFHAPGPDLVLVEYSYSLGPEPMAG